MYLSTQLKVQSHVQFHSASLNCVLIALACLVISKWNRTPNFSLQFISNRPKNALLNHTCKWNFSKVLCLFVVRRFERFGRQRQRQLRGHRIYVRRHHRDLHRFQPNGGFARRCLVFVLTSVVCSSSSVLRL